MRLLHKYIFALEIFLMKCVFFYINFEFTLEIFRIKSNCYINTGFTLVIYAIKHDYRITFMIFAIKCQCYIRIKKLKIKCANVCSTIYCAIAICKI